MRHCDAKQSEDRSLKFPDERSEYRLRTLAAERLVYDKAPRSTVGCTSRIRESDKDTAVATGRPALFWSVVSADGGMRLREMETEETGCGGKLDASTAESPLFSVAIYADLHGSNARCRLDAYCRLDMAVPIYKWPTVQPMLL